MTRLILNLMDSEVFSTYIYPISFHKKFNDQMH